MYWLRHVSPDKPVSVPNPTPDDSPDSRRPPPPPQLTSTSQPQPRPRRDSGVGLPSSPPESEHDIEDSIAPVVTMEDDDGTLLDNNGPINDDGPIDDDGHLDGGGPLDDDILGYVPLDLRQFFGDSVGKTQNDGSATAQRQAAPPAKQNHGTSELFLKPKDTRLYPYKGWMIHSPKIMLARVRNFLADEDMDRTLDWPVKFGALTEYLAYLLSKHKNQDWWPDFRECVHMLRTHRLYEQYHYAARPLVVNFPNAVSSVSTRLPQVPGPNITFSYAKQIKPRDALPGPEKKDRLPGAGIIFTCLPMKNVPVEGAKDPLSYVRLHNQYQSNDRKRAKLARRDILANMVKFRHSPSAIMALPENWKGPVLKGLQDKRATRILEKLKMYRGIEHQLQRQDRIAPRCFMSDTMAVMRYGEQEKPYQSLGLKWQPADFVSSKKIELAYLRNYELEILRLLTRKSFKEPQSPDVSLDDKGKLLVRRVMEMLDDSGLQAFFRDTKLRRLMDFMAELNTVCRGPIKRYRFSEDEVKHYLPVLSDLGLLEYFPTRHDIKIVRPKTDLFPEDRVLWPRELSLGAHLSLTGPMRREKYISFQKAEIDNFDQESDLTGIEHALVVESILDLPQSFARMKRTKKPDFDWKLDYLCRLAYRFGMGLAQLKREAEELEASALSPVEQQRNRELVQAALNNWTKSTREIDLDLTDEGDDGWYMQSYRDIVKEADPETYEELHQGATPEQASKEHVRQSLIREAYNNDTMLWPSNVRNFKDKNGEVVDSWRREPIWTFGHPSIKPKARRFFDMNRWPLHLQSKETQQKIRASGSVMEGDPPSKRSKVKEVEITWKDVANQKESFQGGRAEYWAGDTPKQKAAIRKALRDRFETKESKKRTWSQMVGFGKGPAAPDEDPDSPTLDLPNVPKEHVPRSVARKEEKKA